MTDGMKILKKSKKETKPLCQTIKVVMSPNGENAPPAFAETTILIIPIVIKFLLPLPTTNTTVPRIKAVVRLSAIGDRKKAITPVIQNIFLKLNLLFDSHEHNASNIFLSVSALTKVIATNKKKNNSANSRIRCLNFCSAQ